jgi:hypothetical protein
MLLPLPQLSRVQDAPFDGCSPTLPCHTIHASTETAVPAFTKTVVHTNDKSISVGGPRSAIPGHRGHPLEQRGREQQARKWWPLRACLCAIPNELCFIEGVSLCREQNYCMAAKVWREASNQTLVNSGESVGWQKGERTLTMCSPKFLQGVRMCSPWVLLCYWFVYRKLQLIDKWRLDKWRKRVRKKRAQLPDMECKWSEWRINDWEILEMTKQTSRMINDWQETTHAAE